MNDGDKEITHFEQSKRIPFARNILRGVKVLSILFRPGGSTNRRHRSQWCDRWMVLKMAIEDVYHIDIYTKRN